MAEDRRGYLGGSDIASIFGVSQWKSALDLYEEKTAVEFVPPEIEPKREKLFKRGKRLEPWVVEMLEEERGIFVQKRNQIHHDPEFSWMRAEIDFEYVDDAGMCNGDVKTVSPFAADEWGEEGTDEIPLGYCLQFHWGMMVNGYPKCLVAVLIGADDLRVYEVKRDDELITVMRQRAVQFWTDHVQKKVPPPPVTVSDVHKTLFKYGGFPVKNDPEIMTALGNLRTVKKTEKEVEALKKEYELSIKRRLLVLAQASGVTDEPKRFNILDMTGRQTASLSYQHRSGYTVGETDFWVLRS